MKKRGHYCKICGEYKSNEKFSGKGHAVTNQWGEVQKSPKNQGKTALREF